MPDYAYVAFLDILGYKNLLEKDVLDGTSIFREKMTRAFRHFENINRSRYQYQVISDAIYLTCSERDAISEFLENLRNIFVAFLGEGLLIRGGATFGQHFMNTSVTYSPALTKAYGLETNDAIFPRIMIDENIVTMFPDLRIAHDVLASGSSYFLNIVRRHNFDGLWFKARAIFLSDFDSIRKNEHIRIKHKWLQDYLIESASVLSLNIPRPYLGTFDAYTSQESERHIDAVRRLALTIGLVSASR